MSAEPLDDEIHTRRNWVGVAPPVDIAPPALSSNTDLPPRATDHAARLQEALRTLPRAGDVVFGFTLVRELGRGAFGRVYLATQPDLAERFVALKLSVDLADESRALARLQHTNIVPIYSVHRAGMLHAVCMPYLGATTLADVIHRYRWPNRLPATGRDLVSTLRDRAKTPAADAERVELPLPPVGDGILGKLANWNYTRTVAWLVARLADGLHHAHERGILHRDVKPANILFTDDGQPMLLDFGIAEEIRLRATVPATSWGGTIPYMSPEQFDEIGSEKLNADARSDVYSLGIVLYELLTGHFPFKVTSDGGNAAMIAERRTARVRVRLHNASVSPGLEAIVQLCLAGDPAKRYPSAAHLRDDLDRHLAEQPLAFARERSVRERFQKWTRRNPRLASSGTLAGLVAVALVASAGSGVAWRERLHRLEAEQNRTQFAEELREAQYRVLASNDAATMASGVERGRAALARFSSLEPGWEAKPAFASLPPEEQARVRHELAAACMLVARGVGLASFEQTPPEPQGWAESMRLNYQAEALFGGSVPRVVFVQRSILLRKAGREEEAVASERQAAAAPLQTGRDYMLAAMQHQESGRHAEALPLFRKAQQHDPRMFWAYFAEGISQDALGRLEQARACYTAAVALVPEFHWAYYNRAGIYRRLGDSASAIDDYSRAIELQGGFADAYMNRAQAYLDAKDHAAGLRDLDTALGMGASLATIYPLRKELRRLAGDADGAAGDAAQDAKREPRTEDEWLLRGLDRLVKDKAAALADFEQALRVNPRSWKGLMYKAHVLSETGRIDDCITALTAVLAIDSENVPARAARGVMHARLKHWDDALEDAKGAAARSFAPSNVYQVGSIYAHLSAVKPEYRAEAAHLLGIALRGGFGYQHLATDTDLHALRGTPEFEAVSRTARQYAPRK